MQIDKQQILSFLRDRGDQQQASQADEQLPQRVDTDDPQHKNMLEQLGISPMTLVKQFMGGNGLPGL